MGTWGGIIATLSALGLVAGCSSGGDEDSGATTSNGTVTVTESSTSSPSSSTASSASGSPPPSRTSTAAQPESSGSDEGTFPTDVSSYADTFVRALSDITVPETSAGDYCDALVRAWGAGQRSTADKYATSTAMTGLFDDYGSGGSGWSRTSAGTHSATYTNTDAPRSPSTSTRWPCHPVSATRSTTPSSPDS